MRTLSGAFALALTGCSFVVAPLDPGAISDGAVAASDGNFDASSNALADRSLADHSLEPLADLSLSSLIDQSLASLPDLSLAPPMDLALAPLPDLARLPDLAPLPPLPDLTILPDLRPPVVGALTGMGMAPPPMVNLSMEGTLDWAHWAFQQPGDFDHRAMNGGLISDYTVSGVGVPVRYTDNLVGFSWMGGTPTAMVMAPGTTTGLYINNQGNGYTVTVPAGIMSHKLRMYVGGWMSTGKIVAHLSDGSAADYTDQSFGNTNMNTNNGRWVVVYLLTYNAAADGQTLTVTWTDAGNGNVGNATLQAATLQ